MSTDTLYYDVLENKLSRNGKYNSMGGSQGDLFNTHLIQQLVETVVAATYGENKQEAVACAALEGLKGINPGNEIEGMMAAQLIATHHVSMFCFKRAQSESANIENSRLWINQGTKLSRSFYSLAQALKQDRAKQQAPIGLEQVEPPLQQTTRAKVRHQDAGHHDEHQGGAARQVEEPERELFCGEKTRHVPEHSTPETAPASAGFPNADSQDEPAGAEELAH